MWRLGLIALCSTVQSLGAVEVPLDVRPTTTASFAAKPSVKMNGEKVTIAFAADRATDVEVAVLDAAGKVVRHLAAGLLGKNAPEPLKKDSLAQEVEWDQRDDAGEPASGGPFEVRVRLG